MSASRSKTARSAARESAPAPAQPSTREAIQQAAVKLFFERGYSAATVREIASELGIKAGSIYNHYASKQQILVDVMEQTLGELTEGLDRAIAGSDTPTQAMRAAIVHHVVFHRTRHREAFVADSEMRSLEPDVYERMAKQRRQYERKIQKILSDGQKNGEFEVSDARVVSYAIITACSAVPSWFKPAGRLTIDQVGEIYADLIVKGLRARPA
jgi:AcrR family transcriptional regulator